ncbi:CS1 type fimbrial major subunit [Pseudomonas sp. HR96]|uniref:CS1 type fimbrial major subunit n=1 Tax=Pseudomonas sp. HR96 TaxID=1027966 RepID=UPI002A74F937|nr:CS1 type fimbrial major subunit [Pseudomonas sp. HR96]WPO98212.1 CS1 type fimbrial major subunit [Pseudomonas sp. HR96]
MNGLLKKYLGAVAITTAVVSLPVMATPQEHTIKLTATVPTQTFAVVPREGDWINDPQVLSYNIASDTLTPVRKAFSVINSAAPVSAQLLYTNTPTLMSGSNSIPLAVSFNGITLTTVAQNVVVPTSATAREFQLVIAAGKTGAYTAGTYSGNVTVSFDAGTP